AELERRLVEWVQLGIPRVKMKVGREPFRDVDRVALGRRAIGPDAELYVDANGAYTPKQALAFAERFADHGVSWFEEPVTATDHARLRHVRRPGPPGMEIAAGEYVCDAP